MKARDVKLISTLGNGDVEVLLAKMEGLPYIIGLVRKALVRQLGGGNEG
ncbi:MAG: hypothetical protein MJE68_07475 [Proteobacteria bacterium]|nr:hypothetical protein [Pseudomonadota bacterium]